MIVTGHVVAIAAYFRSLLSCMLQCGVSRTASALPTPRHKAATTTKSACVLRLHSCRALLSRDRLQQVLAGRSVRSQAPLPLLPPLNFPRPPVQGIKRCRGTLGRFTPASSFRLARLVMHLPQVWQGASPSQARFTSACLISLSFRQSFFCRNLSLAEAGAYDYAEVVKSSSVSVSSR